MAVCQWGRAGKKKSQNGKTVLAGGGHGLWDKKGGHIPKIRAEKAVRAIRTASTMAVTRINSIRRRGLYEYFFFTGIGFLSLQPYRRIFFLFYHTTKTPKRKGGCERRREKSFSSEKTAAQGKRGVYLRRGLFPAIMTIALNFGLHKTGREIPAKEKIRKPRDREREFL